MIKSFNEFINESAPVNINRYEAKEDSMLMKALKKVGNFLCKGWVERVEKYGTRDGRFGVDKWKDILLDIISKFKSDDTITNVDATETNKEVEVKLTQDSNICPTAVVTFKKEYEGIYAEITGIVLEESASSIIADKISKQYGDAFAMAWAWDDEKKAFKYNRDVWYPQEFACAVELMLSVEPRLKGLLVSATE